MTEEIPRPWWWEAVLEHKMRVQDMRQVQCDTADDLVSAWLATNTNSDEERILEAKLVDHENQCPECIAKRMAWRMSR